jgi:hypothetical protein
MSIVKGAPKVPAPPVRTAVPEEFKRVQETSDWN